MAASVQLLVQVAAHVQVALLVPAAETARRVADVQVDNVKVSVKAKVARATVVDSVQALVPAVLVHRVAHAHRVMHLRVQVPRSVKVADVVHHQQ